MQHHQSLLDSIAGSLSDTLGRTIQLQWLSNLAGGDINHAALIGDGITNWFLKYHRDAPEGMFGAEAQALTEISEQAAIRVPSPVAYGCDRDTSWLVLEYMEITSNGPASMMGEQLAALHRVTHKQHGWGRDNYIGTTPQNNRRCGDWTMFWRDYRLRPQLEMARTAGHDSRLINKGKQVLESMDQLMDGHQPTASLLHGDLWAGNKAFTAAGQPVIFDPASYYGDRETDIAMTELFGGFEPEFYAAYQAQYPLPDDYRLRRDLYNLYHMLNHLNLFGAGYLSRCEHMVDGLLAKIR